MFHFHLEVEPEFHLLNYRVFFIECHKRICYEILKISLFLLVLDLTLLVMWGGADFWSLIILSWCILLFLSSSKVGNISNLYNPDPPNIRKIEVCLSYTTIRIEVLVFVKSNFSKYINFHKLQIETRFRINIVKA